MHVSAVAEAKEIEFSEGEFLVKTLEGEAELTQAYRLRHKVFAEALRWVPPTDDGQEMDMYDLWGTSIGLFDSRGTLHGMARLLPATGLFMLEQDLRMLLPSDHILRKERDTAEITRLAIDPDIKDKGLSARLLLMLVKGIYHWALAQDVRFLYIEVDYRFFRVLNAMAIACDPLGPPVALPPAGTLSIAAIMDIVRCEQVLGRKRPRVMEWMSTVTATRGNIGKRTIAECIEPEPRLSVLPGVPVHAERKNSTIELVSQ
ncbi:MAG: GNAT family N-acetyltransferase [Nitrospira sp.]|nr:GNAT family N-acetyltransferase [Nitrospira sp.]